MSLQTQSHVCGILCCLAQLLRLSSDQRPGEYSGQFRLYHHSARHRGHRHLECSCHHHFSAKHRGVWAKAGRAFEVLAGCGTSVGQLVFFVVSCFPRVCPGKAWSKRTELATFRRPIDFLRDTMMMVEGISVLGLVLKVDQGQGSCSRGQQRKWTGGVWFPVKR